MRLTNDGVGMHIGLISKPGRRASHGCIRLPKQMAPILYEHTALGTPVKITGSGPDYASYLKQSAAKSKANAAKYAASKKKLEESAAKKAEEAAANGTTPPADPNAPAPKPATPEMKVPEPPPLGAPATPASPTIELKPAAPAAPGTGQQ
jgi:hypothetical protein